ncbi:hypothetical protein SS05631_c04420 [Sinorhizobium sp. CCBAU 05631]|nr:hypothetical protein SS05631_c04420 [Sinorhizobium sp. CCBAU 05631]
MAARSSKRPGGCLAFFCSEALFAGTTSAFSFRERDRLVTSEN